MLASPTRLLGQHIFAMISFIYLKVQVPIAHDVRKEGIVQVWLTRLVPLLLPETTPVKGDVQPALPSHLAQDLSLDRTHRRPCCDHPLHQKPVRLKGTEDLFLARSHP